MTAIVRRVLILVAFLPLAGWATAAQASPAELPPDPTKVSWFPTGLPGGAVPDIAAGVVTKGRQLVMAAGAVVYTSEQGLAWARVGGTPPPSLADNVVAGPDGNFLVAQADGQGFFSGNFGRTWLRLQVRQSDPVRFLAMSPRFATDDPTAFAMTRADWRLFRTDNKGSRWTAVEIEPNPDLRLEVSAIAFSPIYGLGALGKDTDETIFAGTSNGVYQSVDAGKTWNLISAPAAGAPAFGAAGGPASQQGIVVPYEFGDDPTRLNDPVDLTVFAFNQRGIYRSEDAGKTWNRLPLEAEEIRDLDVSNGWPRDPVLVAAVKSPGAVGAVSQDGGQHWQWVAGQNGVSGTAVAMARDFAPIPRADALFKYKVFLPLGLKFKVLGSQENEKPPFKGSREIYLATDADGVLTSINAGESWIRDAGTLASGRPTALAFLPGGPDGPALAGSAAGRLYRSPDGGRHWRALENDLPRGAGQTILSLRLSPDFAGDSTVFLASSSGVWVSHDKGRTWAKTTGPAPATAFDISPTYAQDRTLIAAGQMSTDGGQSWAPLPPAPFPWRAAAFSPRFATDHTIWAGLEGKPATNLTRLYRSPDAGQTWQMVDNSQLRGREVLSVSLLQMESDPIKLFVGADSGLLYSADEGKTFVHPNNTINRNLRDIAHQVISVPSSQAVVLAAADDGTTWSSDRGLTWRRDTSTQLHNPSSASISFDGSVLLVGTPTNILRLGLGSARIYLPAGRKGQ